MDSKVMVQCFDEKKNKFKCAKQILARMIKTELVCCWFICICIASRTVELLTENNLGTVRPRGFDLWRGCAIPFIPRAATEYRV